MMADNGKHITVRIFKHFCMSMVWRMDRHVQQDSKENCSVILRYNN
jgi:hypothetical protein